MDVAFVSYHQCRELDPDQSPLTDAAAAAGLTTCVAGWDDPDVDWSVPRLAALRSCWNYPQHLDAFSQWLSDVAQHTTLLNPVDVVRWNLHKGYLTDLADRGLSVTPTVVVAAGAPIDLAAVVREREWSAVVVKPAVSCNSWRTYRFAADETGLRAAQAHLASLVAERDALVQPFLPAVEGYGERSLIVVDGRIGHAVRRAPRFSDQEDGPPHEPVTATAAERDLALRAFDAATGAFYARVDMVPDANGAPMLMELELIEPSLFFKHGPETLSRYVEGLRRRLG